MTIDKNIKLIKNKIDGFSEEPHYEVDGEKIYQKVSALKKAYESCNTDDPNEIWGRVKFKFDIDAQGQEPKEDIEELYRQRAETIRNKFDYVRVWASGGNDSTHALESFIDAGVQPNELVTYQTFTGTLDTEQNLEQDVAYQAWIGHKKVKEIWPNVLIKFYKILPQHYSWYVKNDPDHFFGIKPINPGTTSSHMVYECYPEILKKDKALKKVCNIYSGPDIQIGHNDKGWFYTFLDGVFNLNFTCPSQRYFFFDPDNKDLTLKIAYICKRHIEKIHGQKHGIWSVKLSSVPELKFKSNKTADHILPNKSAENTGSINDCHKSHMRYKSFLSSSIGWQTLMKAMSWLQNMQDKHPNWFNERLVNKNWLNLQTQPVYFELKEPGIMKK
tara:strand:- start:2219 stop:3379 length:1161 start_codon:yes stop_codon:yes gene_type:complete